MNRNKRKNGLNRLHDRLEIWTKDHQWVAILLTLVGAAGIVWFAWTQVKSVPLVYQNSAGHRFVVNAKGEPLPIKLPAIYELVHVE